MKGMSEVSCTSELVFLGSKMLLLYVTATHYIFVMIGIESEAYMA